MALSDKLVDKRVVARSIKSGHVDAAEHTKMLEELPDVSSNIWRPDEERQERQERAAAPSIPAPAPAAAPASAPAPAAAPASAPVTGTPPEGPGFG